MSENRTIPDTERPLQPTMRLAWMRTTTNIDVPEARIDPHGHRYVLCQWWDGAEEGGEWREIPVWRGTIARAS